MSAQMPPDPSQPDMFETRVRQIFADMLTDPLAFPAEFRAWIPQYIEMNPPLLPLGQVIGYKLLATNQLVSYQLKLKGLGFLAETAMFEPFTGGIDPVPGTIHGGSLGLAAGTVINNIHVNITQAAAGTVPTLIRLGLADANLKMVAVTANVKNSAVWTAIGVASVPLVYTVAADGVYLPVLIQVGTWGTTPFKISVMPTTAASPPQLTASFPKRWGGYGSGLSDLPAVGASLTASSDTVNYWFALS